MQNPHTNLSIVGSNRFKINKWIILVLLIVAAYKIYTDAFASNVKMKYEGKDEVFVTINSGKDYNRFIYQLKQCYCIKNLPSFERAARLLKFSEKMKPGRYKLKEGMSNYELLKMFIKGRQEPLNLVFTYADRLPDLASVIAKQLETDSSELVAYLTNPAYAEKLGFDTLNVLGMFVPNTYNIYWNTDAKSLIQRMQVEYKNFWTQDRLAQAIHLGLKPIQVSILASIVQKETNKVDEMPVVAGVYLNRLKAGIPLQADPTIIFAWNDKTIKRVTHVHTAINSPFNTYRNKGLPPGLICLPSIQSIDAVLNYTKHEYLYFCAREDFSGYHSFAKGLDQHNENARRYQRALNKANIH